MNLIKHLFTKHLAKTLIVGFLIVGISSYISYFVKAAVTVTPATGGSSISADTTGGSFTALTGPIITESTAGEVDGGGGGAGKSIILDVPSGFIFNTASTVIATVTDQGTCGGPNKEIRLTAGNTSTQTAIVTTTQITINVKTKSSGTCRGTITYTGVEVSPTAGTPLASGNITKNSSSTSAITGVTNGVTNFGTLTEVAGAKTQLVITTQPSVIATTATDFVTKPVVAVRDQFGNTLTFDSATTVSRAVVLSTQSCGGTAGSGTLSSTPASGTAVTSGVMTYTAMQYSFAESIKICFTSSGIISALSDAIVVSAADATPPTVSSIVRANPSPTAASSVDFTVTFSESVTGVGTGDFSLTTTGVSGASVTSVSADSGITRTVTVNTGTGSGTIRLDVTDDDTIVDLSANKLGGDGAGNGNFITGEVYSVDKTAPALAFTDDVAVGPVSSDTIAATWGDATVMKWRYNVDTSCSTTAGDYPNSGPGITTQTTEANNGMFTCLYGEDSLGNKSTLASANDINIDVTGPTFIFTNNVEAGPVTSDTIVATWGDATVTKWEYFPTVVCSTSAGDYANSTTSITTQTTETNNGKFICLYGEDSLGNKSTLASANDINIDAAGPTLMFTDNVAAGPVSSDTITADWGDATVKKWEYDADGICSTTNGDYSMFDTDSMTQLTETNNGMFICLYGEDAVSNNSTLASANDINIDTTAPTITALTPAPLTLTDSNVGSDSFVVTIDYSEAMDGSSTPVVAFTPNVVTSGTLVLSGTSAWFDSDTYKAVYDVVDMNETVPDVDIGVTGATDVVGNTQTAGSSVDAFDVDTITPPPPDLTAPTGTVTVGTDPMTEGDLVQEVTVTYDEAMDPLFPPTISFGGNVGAFISNLDGLYSFGNTTWTESFTLTDVDEETLSVTVDSSAGQDIAGNPEGPDVGATFDIDTKAPAVTTITPNLATVADANVGADTFSVTIDFDEDMDGSSTPVVVFTPDVEASGTLTLSGSSDWSDSDTYIAFYDVADVDETVLDVDIDVTGATDVAGNTETAGSSVDAFDVNTITPLGGGGGGNRYYAPFEPLSIMINDGAETTDTPNVILRLTAGSNVERLWVSNDPYFRGAIVEDFNPDPRLTAAVGFLSNLNLPTKIVALIIILLVAALVFFYRGKFGKKNLYVMLAVIALAIIVVSSNAFGDYSRTQLKPWVLSEGDGVKTVYVQYFSSGGYPGLESAVLSDSITLTLGLGGTLEEPIIEEEPTVPVVEESSAPISEEPLALTILTRPANLPETIGRPGLQCTLLITKVMRYGANNDRDEVAKLQTFLREVVGFNDLPTTGYFGPMTDEYVRIFQNMYANYILKPQDLPAPTGIVGRYTMNTINYISCLKKENQ